MKLTVCVVAFNAAKYLRDSLQSVVGLADEIVVVVDDRSSDETEVIAATFKARIYRHKFISFSSQKNYALEMASGDWVLFLDADEQVSDELKSEILRVIPNTDYAGFLIPRLNIIFGKPIYHTNWGLKQDTHLWLFRKSAGKWVNPVHEEVKVVGPVGRLAGYKIHHNYQTVEQFIDKANNYSNFETRAVNPMFDFVRRYFWHVGFLDGIHGLFLSYLQAVYHLMVNVKLWEKKR